MEMLGYISLFFVGVMLGTLGGGGSMLSVPILVYLFSMDTVMASGYSLFIVGITSLVGTILKYKEQLVSFRIGCLFGLPSITAIFLTRKWIVPTIPDIILQIHSFQLTKRTLILGIFAMLMILASLALITKKNIGHSNNSELQIISLIFLGLLIGFLTGFVGVGGGFLIIPALVALTNLPFKTTVGTTLLIITVNSLMGFTGDVLNYTVNWHFLITVTVLAVGGIFIGSRSTKNLSTHKLQIAFGWFILFMGSGILIKEIFF